MSLPSRLGLSCTRLFKPPQPVSGSFRSVIRSNFHSTSRNRPNSISATATTRSHAGLPLGTSFSYSSRRYSSNQSQRTGYSEARQAHYAARNRSLLLYSSATVILVATASYLAVPLYRVFCSQTGYGGTPQTDKSRFSPERLVAVSEQESGRRIRVHFNADSSDSLPWSFTPQQKEVHVLPGETALAFYTATNHSNEDIIGIATYNVTPNNVSRWASTLVCSISDSPLITHALLHRLHLTLPKSNASASKNKEFLPVKKSTCPCSSSSIGISSTIHS